MTDMVPDFNKNLKKYWGRSGLTLDQLAEKAYLSINTLKGFLYRGERDPRLSTLISLATALDCTVNDLIGYPKDKKAEESERILKEIKELIDEHFEN